MLSTVKSPAWFGACVAAATTTLLLCDTGAASAATDPHFVPEETTMTWDGKTATVTFLETDVDLDANATTISTRVSAAVDAVCTKAESTLHVHRAASALRANDYLISFDGTVPGTATVPLKVPSWNVSGYTCVVEHISMTAELEDFWTGATLTHRHGRAAAF